MMSDLGRVLVLAGGLSPEREVSLRSGRRVADALREVDVDVVMLDADASLLSAVEMDAPDAAFVALHGTTGEDGALREVLELLDLPYVGAGPEACRVAFNKPTAKAVVRAAGLSTPASVALPKETFHDLGAAGVLDRMVARLGLPLFVKPSCGGSALGAGIVRRADELPAAMMECFAYGDTALVEQCVEGTEVAVGVVDFSTGPRALPPVEIVPDGGLYDYAARYTPGKAEFFVPARLPEEVSSRAAEAAIVAHQALGLRDLSRSDLIIDANGTVQFLEVNVAPGMTETSTLPLALDAADLELGTVCRDLLQAAAHRH